MAIKAKNNKSDIKNHKKGTISTNIFGDRRNGNLDQQLNPIQKKINSFLNSSKNLIIMSKNNKTGKVNPNWPSTTGNPSGGNRGNNPPKTKK